MKSRKFVVYSEDLEGFLSSNGVSLTKKISEAKKFDTESDAKKGVKNSEMQNAEFTICGVSTES